jgi:glycosyltransferase involved in cell wall biosynthesis
VIVIDATRATTRALLGYKPTGIDRTSLAYVERYRDEALALLSWQCLAVPLSVRASRRLWSLLLAARPSRASIAVTVLWGVIVGAGSLHRVRGQILLNTGHFGLEARLYGLMLRLYRFRPVFFIHDLIPITHPEYYRPRERDRHAARMKNALDLGAGLITNSEVTLTELTSYAARVRMRVPPVVTAPLASGLKRAEHSVPPIAGAYFVVLGTIEARKNHLLLLQVWRRLVERLGSAAPRLVIIGRRGWECENVLDILDRSEFLRGFVIEHSRCADSKLRDYLQHTRALLYPSFAEGYGIAMIEALTLGVPVIVSDLPAFREVAGAIPEYIDSLDGKRWAEVLAEYARAESGARAAQLERLSGFQEPTWSEHFVIVDELLGRVGGQVPATSRALDGRSPVGDGVGIR